MILDKRLEFADALAINTGAAATYLLGDVVDLNPAAQPPANQVRDIGRGEEVFFVATVDTALLSATGTFTLQLITDDNSAMASPAVIWSSSAMAQAALGVGVVIAAVALPIEGVAYERYLGIQQITGTAAFTAGKINAFLTNDVARWKAYKDANN